jgi:hypothetical protein
MPDKQCQRRTNQRTPDSDKELTYNGGEDENHRSAQSNEWIGRLQSLCALHEYPCVTREANAVDSCSIQCKKANHHWPS